MINNILRYLLKLYRSYAFAIRKIFFSLRQNSFGKGAYVSSHVALRKCRIGDYSHIGPYCNLNCVIVGNYCSIAPGVYIGGEEHAFWNVSTSDRLTDEGITEEKTIIGHDVWIGAQCYIRQGVKIGNGVVIGSNSFVNKDIPDYAIAAGSPAKIIRYRFDENIISEIKKTHYWELKPQEARLKISMINTILKKIPSKSGCFCD